MANETDALVPDIIFENEDVLVINKPAGLIVHSDGRTEEPSVADWVLSTFPNMKDVGEAWTSPQGEVVPRPGIVHRLDRQTSGIMVLAKTSDAHEHIKEQFQNREVQKTYRAFVYEHMKEDEGTIEKEIVRIRSKPPRWGVARKEEDKKHRAAVTDWKMLKLGVDPKTGKKISLLELSPKTGRTHQIRVHLKSIDRPVVCDPLYAKNMPCLLDFSRLALHAHAISFVLPGENEPQTFEAPMPPDFQEATDML